MFQIFLIEVMLNGLDVAFKPPLLDFQDLIVRVFEKIVHASESIPRVMFQIFYVQILFTNSFSKYSIKVL